MRKPLDNLLTLIRGLSFYTILALPKPWKYTLVICQKSFALR
jgi:hypothetical protein